MMNRRNNPAAAQRFAERRRREEDAPRLREQVPNLLSLRLDIEERAGEAGVIHTPLVGVLPAPARFPMSRLLSKFASRPPRSAPAATQAMTAPPASDHRTSI